jgi:hypothetical protein
VDSVKRATDTIKTAVECGQWLSLARQNVPHGEWFAWLRVNFPRLSTATARRYVLLFNRIGHVHDMPNPDYATLRQAYLISGVVKEPVSQLTKQEQETEAQVTIPVALPSALLPFTRWHKRVYQEQLPNASRHQLEEWLKELKEAHDTYLEIQARLL